MASVEKQKNLSQNILTAINTVVNSAIDRLDRDKTVMATVVSCTNALTGEYKVKYNGGIILAYSQNETESYHSNESVWVHVPQGNFSNTKTILGKASKNEKLSGLSFITSSLDGYNRIGKNLLENTNSLLPIGLHSYLAQDGAYLYYYIEETREDTSSEFIKYIRSQEMINFNQSEFATYIKNAEALLVQANFKTRLPKAHRQNKNGTYGLIATLAFKNQNAAFKPLTNYDVNEIVYKDYIIDSNNMTGNPFLYENFISQYGLYDIDKDNFLFLKSIRIFSNGFEENDDIIQDNLWGADIFIDSPQIFALQKISSQSGDYIMQVSTPDGAILYSLNSSEQVRVLAKTTYQLADISDATTYYWFAEDNSVSVASEHYQVYGGAGWKYLAEKGNNYAITLSGQESAAKQNNFMVVGVYKQQVVLKQEFTLHNLGQKRVVSIASNMGTKFSFDRGIPTLTCLVDGKEENFDDFYSDADFTFAWSKTDAYGNVFILDKTFDEIAQELEAEWLKDPADYSLIYSLEEKQKAMKDVVLDKNKITYPMAKVSRNASFKCTVFIGDTIVGQGTIILQNLSEANGSDYILNIIGGNQVFQYDEYGTSPVSTKHDTPQIIEPLSVKLFDQAGQEVNKDNYSVSWILQDGDTLLDLSHIESEFIVSENTGLREYHQFIFPLAIKTYYDENCINNQLTASVEYNGEIITRDTELLFTKVGHNGTNGTDIVCRIVPKANTDGEVPTISTENFQTWWWNFDIPWAEEALELEVYQRNEKLTPKNVIWSIPGSSFKSRFYSIVDGSQAIIDVQNHQVAGPNYNETNLIVRAREVRDGQYYYAFLGVPLVQYHTNNFTISFPIRTNLQNITYNADGFYPVYNKNQGLNIKFSSAQERTIVLEACGGARDNTTTANFRLIENKDDGADKAIFTIANKTVNGDEYSCYILPNDSFSGDWTNNVVHGKIFTGTNISSNTSCDVEFWYPIHMMLDTFSLKSLNDWDGNRIEINEDEDYILAPQIGAGEKNEKNQFSGIVMGKRTYYDDTTRTDIGLMGYKDGRQTIFLNSKDGSAHFGLPTDNLDENQIEGCIDLVPNGTSHIGSWVFENNQLYNQIPFGSTEAEVLPKGKVYYDNWDSGHSKDIPSTSKGVFLSANPAYLSVKGRELVQSDAGGLDASARDWDIGNSFEILIDPNQYSIFTMLLHYKDSDGSWKRKNLAGINRNGNFYSNAVRSQGVGLSIGTVGAFGYAKTSGHYRGGMIQITQNNEEDAGATDATMINLFKMFVETGDNGSGHLYLSGSNNINNEYVRGMSLHFKDITLYANSGSSSAVSSGAKIGISDSRAFIGYAPDSDSSSSFGSLYITPTGYSRLNSYGQLFLSGYNGNAYVSLNDGKVVIYPGLQVAHNPNIEGSGSLSVDLNISAGGSIGNSNGGITSNGGFSGKWINANGGSIFGGSITGSSLDVKTGEIKGGTLTATDGKFSGTLTLKDKNVATEAWVNNKKYVTQTQITERNYVPGNLDLPIIDKWDKDNGAKTDYPVINDITAPIKNIEQRTKTIEDRLSGTKWSSTYKVLLPVDSGFYYVENNQQKFRSFFSSCWGAEEIKSLVINSQDFQDLKRKVDTLSG